MPRTSPCGSSGRGPPTEAGISARTLRRAAPARRRRSRPAGPMTRRGYPMRRLLPIALVAHLLGLGSTQPVANPDTRGVPGAVACGPEAARSGPRENDGLERREEDPNSRSLTGAEEPFSARTRVSIRGHGWELPA